MKPPVVVWFRRDLRLTDNPALLAAVESGAAIIPVYVCDEQDRGGASRWWLNFSLENIASRLRDYGNQLIVRRGSPLTEIAAIVRESGAQSLFFTRRYEPAARHQEDEICKSLGDDIDVQAFDDTSLRAPSELATKSGTPFKVFTPYWKAAAALGDPPVPIPAPGRITAYDGALETLAIEDLKLLPTKPDWASGLRGHWQPGEDGALRQLDDALENTPGYANDRDRPDLDRTSHLSPHLHFGELSPRQVWHAVTSSAATAASSQGADSFIRQLYWRDFSAYLLFHFPELPAEALRPEFVYFPWSNDPTLIEAWQRGKTGYPIIDAGMRQLWSIGWMHNRVRMIVASFLVKNLMVDWRTGADWFLDTLVDADLANNSASWQWVAGCGTDSAPYFRIFNPVLQSAKFDPDGDYIRRWIPELRDLDNAHIHEPWKADELTLQLAGIRIGSDYPRPIVDLRETRQRALDAYQSLRGLLQSPASRPGSSAG